MRLLLKRDWEAINGETGNLTIIPAGEHLVERIPNPCGFDAPWLVLTGTKIGATENSWRQWKNGMLSTNQDHPNFGRPIKWGEYEIVILDDDTAVLGYVIQNQEGQTLDRNLLWSSNTVNRNGYVHTEESVEVIRKICSVWDSKPHTLHRASYFNGEVGLSSSSQPF